MNETPHERAAYDMALSQFQAQGITEYLDGEVDALADQFLTLIEASAWRNISDPHAVLEAELNGWYEPDDWLHSFTF